MSQTTIKLQQDNHLFSRIAQMSWGLIFFITVMACIGFLSLYAAAGGHLDPWASKQIMRFCIGMIGLFVIALIDIHWWYRLSYPIFAMGVLALIAVEIMGRVGMGAQRWIDFGFIQIQPSEFMKIAVIMALARYFHTASPEDLRQIRFFLPALGIIAVPVGLVLLQPDLGTALMIVMGGIVIIFLAGAPLRYFIIAGSAVLALAPIGWTLMHDYQRQRVITFLNPESDPLGAGYHIIQSKIALGSGGIEGKGFLGGTQSRLNFLPEKQTDFIFTLWAEEWGLLGGIFLLLIAGLIFTLGGWIALRCRHGFGRLLAFGLTVNFSLYVFINIGMVMGLLPVVGTPLPLVSYGGTSMLAVLTGFGLIQSCYIYRDAKMRRM